MRLKGQVAIVTGAGQGIGRAIAIRFADEGAWVVVNGRHEENIKIVANEIMKRGGKAIALKGDVSKRSDVKRMLIKTIQEFGRINILVNNAAIMGSAPLENIEESDWDRVINTNLKGVFLCCQIIGNEMIKARNGNIINIASIAAHQAFPLAGAYAPSKSGVVILTKQLAIEWAKYNIKVNVICPGIDSPSFRAFAAKNPQMSEAHVKLGDPEDSGDNDTRLDRFVWRENFPSFSGGSRGLFSSLMFSFFFSPSFSFNLVSFIKPFAFCSSFPRYPTRLGYQHASKKQSYHYDSALALEGFSSQPIHSQTVTNTSCRRNIIGYCISCGHVRRLWEIRKDYHRADVMILSHILTVSLQPKNRLFRETCSTLRRRTRPFEQSRCLPWLNLAGLFQGTALCMTVGRAQLPLACLRRPPFLLRHRLPGRGR